MTPEINNLILKYSTERHRLDMLFINAIKDGKTDMALAYHTSINIYVTVINDLINLK